MSFLIIKQKEAHSDTHIQQLLINKNDVSAVYSVADATVKEFAQDGGATLIILMNSGKEFKFKYSHHSMASTFCLVLSQAVQFETAVEIEI